MLSSLRLCRRGLGVARDLCSRRTFMSEQFPCGTAWARRLDSPILRKVNLDDIYVEFEARLSEKGVLSPVDIDIFANVVNDTEHLDELEDLVHRLRLGSGSGKLLPSTHFAVIRAFSDHGEPSELLRILDDRLNYGIFPDDYTNIFLLDWFIKGEDFTSAAKVASMRMLQEDFSSPLLNYMSLFACHKYLLNPGQWEVPTEPEPDTGEEVRVRVKYLRNPYFDDHFDLKEPSALVGKTFNYIGRALSDSIGLNYRAVGLCLHKKWDEAERLIANAVKNDQRFSSSAIALIDQFLGTLPEEEQQPLDQLKVVVSSARNAANNSDLLTDTSNTIKSLVQSEEKALISDRCQTFADWENTREQLLKGELEELRRHRLLTEVELKKEELKREEEEIFFFDNEDKLDIAIENKRVRYPKKWPGNKKRKKVVGEEYTPPEITVKRTWAP